jgi:carboxyl-terminal processing protease
MQKQSHLRVAVLCVVVLLVGFGAGLLVDRTVLTAGAQSGGIVAQGGPDLRMINQAWRIIDQSYVDRSALQSTALTYGAIAGMTDALGDAGHSAFLTPDMLRQEQNVTRGEFSGVGLDVQAKNGHVVIVAPIDGSPAQQAGLKAGEMILKVDGRDVSGQGLDQVIQLILGPAGTTVTLTIADADAGSTFDVTLTRAHIVLHNVSWQPIPGTTLADLRMDSFSHGVTGDLKQALTEIRQQGMTGIVLDLRNNPGGLLDEAIATASEFLKSGNVLLEQDAQGNVTPVPVLPGGSATDIPLVVLVNNGTASAAEIVAGALHDAGRATLIGQTTFGTGTVLNQFPLPDGSALLLATREWLTPGGQTIWHRGLAPDVPVSLPGNVRPLTPAALESLSPGQLQAGGDAQLLRALQQLAN